MANYGERLLKGTSKGFSLIAFETSKKSRIMKKKMRISALSKDVRADFRDLGSLVYNALKAGVAPALGDDEVKALVANIDRNNLEIEKLRESIARISRAKKHFREEEVFTGASFAPGEEVELVTPEIVDEEPSPIEQEPVKEPSPAKAAQVKEEDKEEKEEPSTKEEDNAPAKKAAPKKTPSKESVKKSAEKKPAAKKKTSTTAARKAAKKAQEEAPE
ncbi:MAG: hypothetical protein C0608_08845 [Deltaproteobacteria bacterium]|nr:MAG: hypothetical protein C0608_08845 [Deltaproteobacteria bacterium]